MLLVSKPVVVVVVVYCQILLLLHSIILGRTHNNNDQKTLTNDWFDLKMYMGKFFRVVKLIFVSEIQDFKILTPFVTSQTPNMTQNSPKTPENLIK